MALQDDPRHMQADAVKFAGTPSAMDVCQLRALLRDLGNIERKAHQANATTAEIARIHRHVENELVETAVLTNYRLAAARQMLPAEAVDRLEAVAAELESLYQGATMETAGVAYRQMLENLRQQPIEYVVEESHEAFLEGFEDGLRRLTLGLYRGRRGRRDERGR